VRGLVLGLFLLPALVVAILSIRPGGLRQQLRYLRRRFKLAMVLAGIYLAASTLARLFLSGNPWAEWGLVGLAALLGLVFLVLAQDPDTPESPESPTPPAAAASPQPPPPGSP
jgi:hypothetical protein